MIKEIKDGKLFFDGCDTTELAKNYGTPLYVLSQTDIEDKFDELNKDFVKKYPGARVAYASKAFCSTAMYKLCEKNGSSIDVVSGGELYTAIKAGFPAERIEFNGNNKFLSEIEAAVDYGIGRFIVDGLQEIPMIEKVCREKNKNANVLIRITPGVAASTHDYVVTGKKDSKFGIPLDNNVFLGVVKDAIESGHINFMGLHFHVGSQIFENEYHLKALEITLEKVRQIKENFGYDITELNLGGGFAANYVGEDRKPFRYYLDPMMKMIKSFYTERNMKMPSVVIEPGRSIIAEAGITLYTIGSIKEIKGLRKYVSVDGGMTDNLRPALYQAEYTGIVANKAAEACNDVVSICGKCCESGDILIRNANITGTAEEGDLFAVYSTGAYGYSMASNYNSNQIPAVVLVKDGKSCLIIKRQTYEQIIENNIVPDSLL